MTDTYGKQQKPGIFTQVRTKFISQYHYINPYNLYLLHQAQIDITETEEAKLREDQLRLQLVLDQHLRNKNDTFLLKPEFENPYKIEREIRSPEIGRKLIEYVWLPVDLEILKIHSTDDAPHSSYLLQSKKSTITVGLDTHIMDEILTKEGYPPPNHSPKVQISDMLIQELTNKNNKIELIFHRVKYAIKHSSVNTKYKTLSRIWQKRLRTEQDIYYQRDQYHNLDTEYANVTPRVPFFFKQSGKDYYNGSFYDNDYYCGLVIYEYVEGLSLSDINLSKLKVGELLIMALQVLEHVNWLHELGYAHRDISLNNIIVNLDSRNVESIDFDSAAEIGKLALIGGRSDSPLAKTYYKFRSKITPLTLQMNSWNQPWMEPLEELYELHKKGICKIKNNDSIAALAKAEYRVAPQIKEVVTARSDYWGCGKLLLELFNDGKKLRESKLSNKQTILKYIYQLQNSTTMKNIDFNLIDVMREISLAIHEQLESDLRDLHRLLRKDAKSIKKISKNKFNDPGWYNTKGKKLINILNKLEKLQKRINVLGQSEMDDISDYLDEYEAIYEKALKLFEDPKYIKGLGRNRKWYRRFLNGLTRPIIWAIGENRVNLTTYLYGLKYTRSNTASFFGELRVSMREQYNEARAFMNQARRLTAIE